MFQFLVCIRQIMFSQILLRVLSVIKHNLILFYVTTVIFDSRVPKECLFVLLNLESAGGNKLED